jgi:TolB-like protein/Tfp pilus assembly protein PilF
MPAGVLRFGPFELDSVNFRLRRSGKPVRLDRIPLELLLLLTQRPGKLVTHQEAVDRIWGREVFIEAETALYTAVRKIRRALHDHPARPRYVETVPRKGYRFIADLEAGARTPEVSGAPVRVILAVLPLDNLSGDARQDYFSDGLTEELITQLGRLSPQEMGVISRTSVMRYKGTRKSVAEIGRELGADYLLEGSARLGPGRVRIAAQLIRVADETHAWAESYERPLDDVLRVQAEVATAVAQAIRLKLTPAVLPSGGVNPEAHDYYLRARELWNQRTPSAIQKAISYFEKALQINSSYAQAWAGLGTCFAILPITSDSLPRECFPQAREAAEKALALEDTLPEALIARGLVHFWFDWDWGSAEQKFRRAIEINPSDSNARLFLAHVFSNLARHAEALEEIRRAHCLDPLSRIVNTHEGHFLYNARQYDSAAAPLERALELDPHFWVAHITMGKLYGMQSRYRASLREFAKAFRFSGGNTEALALRGHAFGASGNRTQARRVLRELEQMSKRRYVPPVHRALPRLGLGENGAALDTLEEALEVRDVRMTFLAVEPRWDALRVHPIFQQLLKRVGLPFQNTVLRPDLPSKTKLLTGFAS